VGRGLAHAADREGISVKTGILGAGAMGSLVGAHIKKGGGEVYFIDIFEEHMKAICENGLIMEIEGEPEPQTVFVDGATSRGEEVGPCDLVIVLVKCVDIETAVEANPALFSEDTIVVALQNGVGSVDILAKYFPQERLGVGTLKSSANIISPGRIIGRRHFPNSPIGVYFAPVDLNTPHRHIFEELERQLNAGGMPAECNDHVEEYIWNKLVSNVMGNGIAALLQLANEDAIGHEDGWALMTELAREACEVANAKGFKLNVDDYMDMKSGASPYDRNRVEVFHFVSAVFDSYQMRKTEIDFLNGTIVREGKKLGIPTPYNETVWRLVRVMQDNYEYKFKPHGQ